MVSDQQLTFAIFSRRPPFSLVACVAVMKQLFSPHFNLQIDNPNSGCEEKPRVYQAAMRLHSTCKILHLQNLFNMNQKKASWTVKTDYFKYSIQYRVVLDGKEIFKTMSVIRL
jgi:hypothetical protein